MSIVITKKEKKPMKCRKCRGEVHPLEIFPDHHCLECYAACPETQRMTREMTAEKLARMWGGGRR